MRQLLLCLLAVAALAAAAQPALNDFKVNPRLSASNHAVYPYMNDDSVPPLSATPAGYEPFFLTHYGRHGSRWLTSAKSYATPVLILEKARRSGHLTATGEQTLALLKQVQQAAVKRNGELSDVGAEQHQAIARRMVRNFPQVFAGNAHVDARSTIILRCILSMINETNTLKGLNPQLRVTADASMHDMHYTGWGYGEDTLAAPIKKRMGQYVDSVERATIHPGRVTRLLIAGDKFIADSIDQLTLESSIFNIAGSLQNHHAFDGMDLLHLFTPQEMYEHWRMRNLWFYLNYANAPKSGNRMPFVERAMLRHMVHDADSAARTGQRGASLCFGHETCLLPLACLMELDSVNLSTTDLRHLDLHWINYRIFPMAANIQMVLYRPTGGKGDMLVKVLLNEHEATLPRALKPVTGPYYRWSEVRDYYRQKTAAPTDWSY